MYRIHFDHKSGKFIIQVSSWFNFAWQNVICGFSKEALYFDTYDKAVQHVNEIGLNKLYQDRSHNQFVQQIQGYQPIVSGDKMAYPRAPFQV